MKPSHRDRLNRLHAASPALPDTPPAFPRAAILRGSPLNRGMLMMNPDGVFAHEAYRRKRMLYGALACAAALLLILALSFFAPDRDSRDSKPLIKRPKVPVTPAPPGYVDELTFSGKPSIEIKP